jgi:formamidopyrimidine-DNA glycosylase
MPELPEVETVTQGIRTELINKKIKLGISLSKGFKI